MATVMAVRVPLRLYCAAEPCGLSGISSQLQSSVCGVTSQGQLYEPRMRSGSWDDGRRHHHGAAASRTLSSDGSWCSAATPGPGSDRELELELDQQRERELDLSSDEESEKSSRSNGQLSALSKARTLCDKWRGQSAMPEPQDHQGAGAGPTPGQQAPASLGQAPGQGPGQGPGQAPGQGMGLQGQGRLLRWFSMRRGSNHYEVEGQGQGQGSSTGDRPERKMPLLAEVSEGEQVDSSDSAPLIPSSASSSPQHHGHGKVDEESTLGLAGLVLFPRRQLPPSLPPAPSNLTPQQLKRRYIVAAIVHSENSYVATLQRLVNDYKKPLEDSQPPILSASKIQTLFHRLPEILQCHTLFRIALAESVRAWDREERLGDVFVASFSKAIVLDIYSGFINNFSVAMELAKQEAKRKSALADFFKVKQISSHDRLSFFGLMVKPVQRFPQFILFLQDLLKHTPQGHHDRMSLQLALTQLESLAEMLNERKREAEQFQAFREMLRLVSGKFSARPLAASDGSRCLLREDNVQQLEFNAQGLISKTKSRRLLLLNDLLVCVAVSPSQRLSLKWSCPVSDIEVVDNSTSPTLSRLLTAGQNKGGSLKSSGSGDSSVIGGHHNIEKGADGLCAEMGDLMHDFEVVSRIQDLVAQLRGNYSELSTETTKNLLSGIQAQIQQRDEEMAWLDSCCLQLKRRDDTLTFQMESPASKHDWITELRLAQLALDANNSPAWEVPEQERRPSTKMPLFVRARTVAKTHHHSEVRCGCYYTVSASKASLRQASRKGRTRNSSYLWVCTSDGANSHITVMTVGNGREVGLRDAGLRDAGSLSLTETSVSAMEFVRGDGSSSDASPDTVWIGTESRKLFLYAAVDPETPTELGSVTLAAGVTHIRAHCDTVFVALSNGSLLVVRRKASSIESSIAGWALNDIVTVTLGTEPVAYLLPINLCLYAACGNKVFVVSALTGEVQKHFSVAHGGGSVHLMAHSGIGLWISLLGSSTICLYHTETFKHLQDINIASNVVRVTTGAGCSGCAGCVGCPSCSQGDCANNNRSQSSTSSSSAGVSVTALLAGRGLLWVGTNVGIALTIPLPRLEGVPIISGRVNISYHAHFGPITFLLALQPRPIRSSRMHSEPDDVQSVEEHPTEQQKDSEDTSSEVNESEDRKKRDAARLRHQLTSNSSPVVLRRRHSKQPPSDIVSRRASKTLPRGLGMFSTSTTSSQGSGEACDVYGLYGELMYVKDYDGEETVTDPAYESLRRSDPELAAIPGKVSTLDRQLRLKASRPRSLDLSNWSVDSRTSSLYTSSGSEDSRPVSRQNSMAGDSQSHVANQSVVSNEQSNDADRPVSQQTSNKSKSKPKERAVEGPRRTVITLMGGRGYVNWRQSCCPTNNERRRNSSVVSNGNSNANNKEPNSSDAHLVVWEMKL
ncbi:Rho guanine nucleotide exchange factor 10 [Frankliniella fusca]|uniref:Rho guanine nucleotide exchange factor 10 n=1 Tax=Frankliniella fusca TaxID=407009 RepID=A0AAE1GZ89_9NEOP|nr:Rho guanine nucleotide exchange factor 10 [Frankliniella fusca]